MSIDISIDKAQDTVFLILAGEVDLPAFFQEMDATLGSPDFHTRMRALIDLRDPVHCLSSEDVANIAQYFRTNQSSFTGGRAAVVVSQTAIYGMMRMLQIRVDEVMGLSLFYDMNEARRWLGLPAT